MKKSAILIAILVLANCGCQGHHSKNKQQALERWQNSRAKIMLDMARQQYQAHDLDKALASAQRAEELSPKDAAVHILIGQIAMEKNDLSQAKKRFDKAVSLDEKNADAVYHLGLVCERRNDLKKASEYYQQAWTLSPDNADYFRALGESLMTQGRADEAWELLKSHPDLVHDSTPLNVLAGDVLHYLGRDGESVNWYRDGLSLQPDNVRAIESLAFALYRTGQWEEALAKFKLLEQKTAGAGVKNKSIATLMAMGDCCLQNGQYHPAQRYFEEVCGLDKNNALAWSRLSQSFLGRGDYDAAVRNAQQALSLDANQSEAQLVLGYASMMQQDYSGAEKQFRQVIERDGKNSLAYCYLGKTLQMSGQTDAARKCFEEALRLNPSDPLAKKLMDTTGSAETPRLN